MVGDLIGSGEAQERGIVGETPNLAARLQGIAEPNTVVIAESTRRLLGRLFDLEDLGAKELKGIAGPVPAWAVLRANTAEIRFEALHAAATSLVGREEEFEVLKRRWQWQERSGPRGRALGRGRASASRGLWSRSPICFGPNPTPNFNFSVRSHGQHSALFPVIAGLERAAGFEYSDTPEAKCGKLATLIMANSDVAEDVALITELLSLPLPTVILPINYSPQRKKEKTLDALLRHLAGVTKRQPVLLIFEDIHWIDPPRANYWTWPFGGSSNCRSWRSRPFAPSFNRRGQANRT